MSFNGSAGMREGVEAPEAQSREEAQTKTNDEGHGLHHHQAHIGSAANTPNDSEAETEILADSRRQTPRKKDDVKRESSTEAINQPNSADALRDEPANSIERPDSPPKSRKRKVEERDGHNDRAVSAGQASHDEREMMVKKARLSSNSESESDPKPVDAGSRHSRPQLHERKAESEFNLRSIKARRDHLPSLELSSTRASTHSPLSHPKSPVLRTTRHTRSTSFHSTAPLHERETRLRKRIIAPEETWDPDLQAHTMAPRPKDVDQSGRTPLARAAYDGNLEKVRTILKTSTEKLDQPDYAGNSPLQMAACKGHAPVVKELLAYGANVNTINMDGDTPLQDAEDNGHEDVINLLKAKGAQRKVKENTAQSLPRHRHHYQQPSAGTLLEHIKAGDAEGVGRTLEVTSIKPNNECVVAAVNCGNVAILEIVLAYGGDPDPQKEEEGVKTPLMAAVDSGNVPALKILLQQEANPNRFVFGGKNTLRQYATAKKAWNWHEVNQAINVFTQYRDPRNTEFRETTTVSGSGQGTQGQVLRDLPVVPEVPEGTSEGTGVADTSVDPKAQQVARSKYLAALPRGLRKALEAGVSLPVNPPSDANWRHLKSVADFRTIPAVPLCEIVEGVSPEHANELWAPNVYGSVLLGHTRLDEIRALVSGTRPMTKAHRGKLWRIAGMGMTMSTPSEYDRAKDEIAVHQQDGVRITVEDHARQLYTAYYDGLQDQGYGKWMGLGEDEVWWIRVGDLVGLTKPDVCPRLEDLIIRFMTTCHLNPVAYLKVNGLENAPMAQKQTALGGKPMLRFKNGTPFQN